MNAIFTLATILFIPSMLVAQTDTTTTLGNNIVSFSPVVIYAADHTDGLMTSLSYERFVGKVISIVLPVSVGISDPIVQVALGPKIYPCGHEGLVKYSIAPMVVYTTSERRYRSYYFDPDGNRVYRDDERIDQLGFVMLHAVNVTLDQGLYVTTEGGLGVNYFSDIGGLYNNPSVTAIVRMSLGYRF